MCTIKIYKKGQKVIVTQGAVSLRGELLESKEMKIQIDGKHDDIDHHDLQENVKGVSYLHPQSHTVYDAIDDEYSVVMHFDEDWEHELKFKDYLEDATVE